LSLERAPIDLRQSHAHERGCDIGPVIDILVHAATPPAYQVHRVDIEQEGGRALSICRLGIEDVGFPEPQVKDLGVGRVLVEQET
jgi:hypothetical protein